MNINTNSFKNLFLIFFLIGLSSKIYSQETDIWTGNFIVKSPKSVSIDTIRIQKVILVNNDDETHKFDSDISAWIITSKKDNFDDKIEASQFLFDKEDDENEYEQFGWTELYLNGQMKCIDAGHFFICKTKPNSEVKINDEDSFLTKTGLFGIRLHYGLFILERLHEN